MITIEDYTANPLAGISYFAQAYAQLLIDGAGWSTTALWLYDLNGERGADPGNN